VSAAPQASAAPASLRVPGTAGASPATKKDCGRASDLPLLDGGKEQFERKEIDPADQGLDC